MIPKWQSFSNKKCPSSLSTGKIQKPSVPPVHNDGNNTLASAPTGLAPNLCQAMQVMNCCSRSNPLALASLCNQCKLVFELVRVALGYEYDFTCICCLNARVDINPASIAYSRSTEPRGIRRRGAALYQMGRCNLWRRFTPSRPKLHVHMSLILGLLTMVICADTGK